MLLALWSAYFQDEAPLPPDVPQVDSDSGDGQAKTKQSTAKKPIPEPITKKIVRPARIPQFIEQPDFTVLEHQFKALRAKKANSAAVFENLVQARIAKQKAKNEADIAILMLLSY